MASTLTNNARRVSSVFKSGLFKDKVAIVTGGGTGIGKAITQELLYLGCNVMIASRNEERLEKAALEMRSEIPDGSPAQLGHVTCNIRKEEQVQNLISSTLAKFGRLDYLVNNGGGQFVSPSENISIKGWNAVLETNLTGTFLCCREAYNQWMSNHGGAIINIIADMWKGMPYMSHSGAARAGVDNLTKSLALEWIHNGVRINSIAPGSSIYSETAAANYGDMKIFDAIGPKIPGKRLGNTEEISGAVCFLLSPAAAYITGETLKIDAGSSIYRTVLMDVPDHNKLPAYSWTEGDNPKSKL